MVVIYGVIKRHFQTSIHKTESLTDVLVVQSHIYLYQHVMSDMKTYFKFSVK